MLIFLSNRLEENADNILHQEDTRDALSTIASIGRSGNHLVLGGKTIIQKLAESLELTESDRNYFKNIYNNLTQLLGVKNELSIYVNVTDEVNGIVVRNHGDQTIICVQPTFFSDLDFTGSTILLAENLTDTRLYRMIGEYVAKEKNWKLPLMFTNQGGGGDTTHAQYNEIQDDRNHFCLCVVDSDKRYPNDQYGRTALNVLDIDDDDRPYCNCLVIPARTAENLIPTSIYQQVISDNDFRHLQGGVIFLERMDGNDDLNNKRAYLNIKDGITGRCIFDLDNGNPEKRYWIRHIVQLYEVSNNVEMRCVEDSTCHYECRCEIFGGFGNQILDMACNTLNRLTHLKKKEKINPEIENFWKGIGEKVIAWGIGYHRTSV